MDNDSYQSEVGRDLRNRGFIYRWKVMVEVLKERDMGCVLREHS
jgi:hypothetical protein